MSIPDDINRDKLAEVALAILCLTAIRDDYGIRAWKGIDWDVMDMLCERGWIHDSTGKAKSVVVTEEGLRLAEQFLEQHFATPSK